MHAGGASVDIAGADARKIFAVLRLRDGDRIEIVDSAGTLFEAVIALDRGLVRAHLVASSGEPAPMDDKLRVDVAQAVPKGQKMDYVVEKATELGAGAILPFYSERTAKGRVGAAKIERWRRIAKASAQQSGRRTIPVIEEPIEFKKLLARFGAYDAVLFPWELAERRPLRERLPERLAGVRRILVAIGPEGGFSHDEAEAARAAGAELVWLGPRILRTETAALALLSVLAYAADD